jgi:hypothetical protein
MSKIIIIKELDKILVVTVSSSLINEYIIWK